MTYREWQGQVDLWFFQNNKSVRCIFLNESMMLDAYNAGQPPQYFASLTPDFPQFRRDTDITRIRNASILTLLLCLFLVGWTIWRQMEYDAAVGEAREIYEQAGIRFPAR